MPQQLVHLPSSPPLTRMTSERCDLDVWTGTFAHECSVNHSWSNLGECVRRCVEVASDSRLPFSSPPTTRRARVKVLNPASTGDDSIIILFPLPPLALEPNSDLDRLHETSLFTSVTRSRTVGRTSWTGDQLVARPLTVHKHRKTHRQHKH
jgi:hypothetical protein